MFCMVLEAPCLVPKCAVFDTVVSCVFIKVPLFALNFGVLRLLK